MNRNLIVPLIIVLFFVIEIYSFQAIRVGFQNSTDGVRKTMQVIYWTLTVLTIASFLYFIFTSQEKIGMIARGFIMSFVFGNVLGKLLLSLFLLLDDLQRGFRWIVQKVVILTDKHPAITPTDISRTEFLTQAGLIVSLLPLAAMSYGIVSGAHDYRIRRHTIKLPHLPGAFDGLKIVQISDVHSGSFFNKTAVKGGVEMILQEKPDVVFFTGDLVNNVASEMKDYFDIFKKIKADLGVFSTLGNHDYGDYVNWSSMQAKQKNLTDLMHVHKLMGWDLLMNEHRYLKQGNDKLAIIGIENWGAGSRWPKYGKLDQASRNVVDSPVKILLSHDPSHWDAQVRPAYKDIDLMLSGHTHGFQFGIEAFGIKWSPVQYVYKQWAGLYQQNNQYLYVNRGFGYIGFPGRIGMPPEITVLELKKG